MLVKRALNQDDIEERSKTISMNSMRLIGGSQGISAIEYSSASLAVAMMLVAMPSAIDGDRDKLLGNLRMHASLLAAQTALVAFFASKAAGEDSQQYEDVAKATLKAIGMEIGINQDVPPMSKNESMETLMTSIIEMMAVAEAVVLRGHKSTKAKPE